MSKPVEPRVMTADEVEAEFLRHVAGIVDYWDKESRVTSAREKMEGVAFSILVLLDGGAALLPAYAVSPRPHPSDEEYRRGQGQNWYPSDVDIAGSLHEKIHGLWRKT